MFTNSAEYYDKIYAKFKDYDEEAEKINAIIQKENPKAETILDVACGTGKHIRILQERFGYKTTGTDLDKNFIGLAQNNFPEGEFFQADMKDFSLDKKFDVITCLFSSIGYVKEPENVIRTLRCFRKHLNDDGILLVEPWITPENFTAGHFTLNTVDEEDLKVARMIFGEKEGNISRFSFEYLIVDANGIRRESEIHELALFSVEEMSNFFEESGFKTAFDSEGLIGRGLYVAKPV